MTAVIAIKVDVDTLRGHREGVPALLNLFKRRNIKASIFFSFGPDASGKALRRIFRPGFISKMIRTRAPSTYGLKTLLYGTLLPAPLIVQQEPDILRRADAEGHECGIHCWDHVFWQDKLSRLSQDVISDQFAQAMELYEKITKRRATCCAAPGWQVTPSSLAVQQRLGFQYCSDSRGRSPFFPVLENQAFQPLQIPSTVPTMDEMMGLPGLETDDAMVDHWLAGCNKKWNVVTIHAEMEGLSKLSAFDAFLNRASAAGFSFAPLSAAVTAQAPQCRLELGTLPGRAGTLALQGSELTEV